MARSSLYLEQRQLTVRSYHNCCRLFPTDLGAPPLKLRSVVILPARKLFFRCLYRLVDGAPSPPQALRRFFHSVRSTDSSTERHPPLRRSVVFLLEPTGTRGSRLLRTWPFEC
jgi:hypothetical protein